MSEIAWFRQLSVQLCLVAAFAVGISTGLIEALCLRMRAISLSCA